MIQKVLYPVREFAGNYVDDFATYSNDWKAHLIHVDQTLSQIKGCGLT
jgi:hypothetical protein